MAAEQPGAPSAHTTMSSEWYEGLWRGEWMDYSRYGPTRRHVRKIIHTLIAPLYFESVLDVGCGEGSLLAEIGAGRPSVDLAGTDVSSEALRYAERLVPGGSFALLDLERAALPQQADLTICSEVLEHLEADEDAIANLAAMTRRYLVVVVPQGTMRGFERENVGHVRNYTRTELCGKLERGGFEPWMVVEWGFPFFSPLYRDFLDRIPSGAVKGRMGWRKRLVSELLYRLFELNAWDRGDKLVVLAARVRG
jgi:SAM-dependent methyltransferase